MDYRKTLMVEPGSPVKLKNFDPEFKGDVRKKEAADAMAGHLERITRGQRLLYGEKRHALLIVLQGIDAAGKDGTCWHVMRAMNPLGATATAFKEPTPEEREHDFLWRVHHHTPGRGSIAIFNRSHYEDVLIARVHDLVPEAVWSKRYDQINDFERLLSENGVVILKFFLLISPDEQLRRFGDRLNDPGRQWKISEADYSERVLWDRYGEAFEAMLAKCSTPTAPWFVIPANRKWFRNLAVSQIVADTLDDLQMALPAPTVDLAAIRAKYHAAEAASARPDDEEEA